MSDQVKLKFSPEVKAALAANTPIVALESTVIAHGLPRPQNLATAQRLEKIIRDADATPATIAILNGEICVGLSGEQIRFIAETDNIKKISTRDLPIAMAQRWNGATTVATTSWIAHRPGITIFSTGGIGGVHRGNQTDVSADLPILATTAIVVVCSGAKIVLDLPATREWLETHGIPVVGYGCDELPAINMNLFLLGCSQHEQRYEFHRGQHHHQRPFPMSHLLHTFMQDHGGSKDHLAIA